MIPPIAEALPAAELSIEQIYTIYYTPVLAYLVRLVNDYAAAEDLCQETFVKVLRTWNAGLPILNVSAWLYRIATNTAYDYLRRRRRVCFTPLQESLPTASGPVSMEARLNEQEPVRTALAQLPTQYRHLLLLRDGAGHSTEEIADALGCSPNAIRLRLFRARERFRQAYMAAAAAE